jgi:hypothetical protein
MDLSLDAIVEAFRPRESSYPLPDWTPESPAKIHGNPAF